LKDIEVFQPHVQKADEDGLELYMFTDLLYITDIAFPVKGTKMDDIDVWTHEFTEPTVMALVLGETQFLYSLEVELESKKYGSTTPMVWHVVVSLHTKSHRRVMENDKGVLMILYPNTYLKDFTQPPWIIDLE